MAKASYNKGNSTELKRVRDYQKLFSTDTGQNVLLDLCRRYSLMEKIEPTDMQRLQQQTLAYLAGSHAVLKDILSIINKNPLETKQEVVSYERRQHDTDD